VRHDYVFGWNGVLYRLEGVALPPGSHERLRALEAANGGAVPLPGEEFRALREGDVAALARLAARRGSSLRFLFRRAE
jgi:hypothetical protein